jgi:DNA replication and repair protein RecF
MILKNIKLSYFRNFSEAQFNFYPDLNIILGKNARGKTSLLEAIYTLLSGTGFREVKELELIQFEKEQAILSGIFSDGLNNTHNQIQLLKADNNRTKKNFFINKTKKSVQKFKSTTPQAVLFAPEDIQIITGSPSRRRRYFDEVLSNIDPVYKNKLHNYEEALRKRNKILETFESESKLREELKFWDNFLIEQSNYIVAKRQAYIDFLNEHNHLEAKLFRLLYSSNPFNDIELQKIKERELFLRRTLIGPHKDDYKLFMKKEDRDQEVDLYGSRSEQRIALFWLKRNELLYFESKSEFRPILLLDDIFSELDDENRVLIMEIIVGYQTIATTTEEEVKNIAKTSENVIVLG